MKKAVNFLGVLALSCALCAGGAWASGKTEAAAPKAGDKTAAWLEKAQLGKADTADQLYEAAKKEGKVVAYSMSSRIKDVKASFEARYPGVVLEAYDMRNTEIFEKAEREFNAGVNNADVLFVKDSDGTMANDFVKKGIVHAYVPQDIGTQVPEVYKKPGLASYVETKLVFFNSEVNDKDPVGSWWDLTRPEWKGRIMLCNPLTAIENIGLFCSFVQHADEMAASYKQEFGEELKLGAGSENAGYEYIRRLAANDLVITNSDQEIVEAIGAAGQKKAPIGIATSSKIREKSKGLKLSMVLAMKPKTSTANPGYLVLAGNAPHVNAAKLLVRWMIGDSDGKGKGFERFNIEGAWPTRADQKTQNKLALAEMNLWPEDADFNFANSVKVTNFWLSLTKK